MLTRFIDYITNNHLLNSEDKILLAVSGGIDSMVLLNLFTKTGFEMGIAHCNFQLRELNKDKNIKT